MKCHWCEEPATRFDDQGAEVCALHGVFADVLHDMAAEAEAAVLHRYAITTKWWELVPPPAWMGCFWFTEMIWNLTVHHSCSLDTYHDAEAPWQAQAMAYEFVEKYPWSDKPKYRILVGRARLIE